MQRAPLGWLGCRLACIWMLSDSTFRALPALQQPLSNWLNLTPQTRVVTQNHHLGDYNAYLRAVRTTLAYLIRNFLQSQFTPEHPAIALYLCQIVDWSLLRRLWDRAPPGRTAHMPGNKWGQSQHSWEWRQGDDYQVVTFWHWALKISSLEFSNVLNGIEFRLRRKKGWFNCRDFNMWFQKVCIFFSLWGLDKKPSHWLDYNGRLLM